MRAIAGLWRWRHNPLRRTTDLVEALVALAAALLIAVAAPFVGSVAGGLTQDALHQAVQAQHENRHKVTATVVRTVTQPPVDPDPETATARDGHRRVVANWTAPDGSQRSGTVTAGAIASPGDRIPLWTDETGRPAARPMDSGTATVHAVLAGLGVAAAAAATIEGVRRLVLWRMVCRRYADWDREWAASGPDWGRTGTGS
ncbi:Rv1733c family protein [Streptomyces cavernicola]|uniref:Proline rich protein membrane protein n=1 Tax=Streptomyces cavernicola TaxID=3043613 RepID=A0ABT6S9V8_9ACTN|nr:hypothetical protein [Streptomyces sp. B-S-A6]MDI3404739.1 hypothetical protein [Streptomyces sp. B-S-A6]